MLMLMLMLIVQQTTQPQKNNSPLLLIRSEQTRLVPIADADATRNASSHKNPVEKEKKMAEQSDHEEDNDYLDTILQESIDAVNRRSFGGHAVRHQQAQQEMVLSSDEESENDSTSSELVVDAVQQFQHEMVSSDEESENDSLSSERVCVVNVFQQFQQEMVSSDEESENDSTPSPTQVDAVQQKSGNKREQTAQSRFKKGKWLESLAKVVKYKEDTGNCNVPRKWKKDPTLGKWVHFQRRQFRLRQLNRHNHMTDERIRKLEAIGFEWNRGTNSLPSYIRLYEQNKELSAHTGLGASENHVAEAAAMSSSEEPADVPQIAVVDGEEQVKASSSERVCVVDAVQQFQHEMVSSDKESEIFSSTPSAQIHILPYPTGTLPTRIHIDAVQQKTGNKRKRPAPIQSFDDRFNDLMAFKAKYGHCDASQTG
jgi:hypothetical protein